MDSGLLHWSCCLSHLLVKGLGCFSRPFHGLSQEEVLPVCSSSRLGTGAQAPGLLVIELDMETATFPPSPLQGLATGHLQLLTS